MWNPLNLFEEIAHNVKSHLTRRAKVIIVSAWPPALGGVAIFAEQLVNDSRFKKKVEFIKYDAHLRPSRWIPEDVDKAWTLSAPILRVFSAARKVLGFTFLALYWRPDVVQIHYNAPFRGVSFVYGMLCYLVVAHISRARIIVRHGGSYHAHMAKYSWINRLLIKHMYLSWVDCLILQWPAIRDAYVAFAADIGISIKTIVVPNTVDTVYFAPKSKDIHEADLSSHVKIGFVGGPDPEVKGTFTTLDALEKLDRDAMKRVVASAIGTHPDVSRRLQNDTFNSGTVELLGYVSGEAKKRWFQSLDIFLLPSLSEGFPNTLLEAMSCGVAVITTPVGAIPWVIEHEWNGLLVEPGDTDQLATAILRLLTDSELRRRLSAKGRETVLEHFSSRGVWVDEILELYE